MQKLVKVIFVGLSLTTLVACSTTNPDGADIKEGAAVDANNTANYADNGVSTGGAGDADSFGAAGNNADKMRVANQSYYFDFNQYEVHSDDLASIKIQADYLAAHTDAKVLLAGNTDERGSREYNIALGNKRAQSVADQLKADGVAARQITTVSYGAEKPIETGHDEAAWAKNRRVDIRYETPITVSK